DGVDEEWEQIVALDEEEAMQRAEFVAGFATAGEDSSTAADLDASGTLCRSVSHGESMLQAMSSAVDAREASSSADC
ncbi:MAG: hypothetical protein WD041_02565, partial [Nitriliruptoraceae bacterium]